MKNKKIFWIFLASFTFKCDVIFADKTMEQGTKSVFDEVNKAKICKAKVIILDKVSSKTKAIELNKNQSYDHEDLTLKLNKCYFNQSYNASGEFAHFSIKKNNNIVKQNHGEIVNNAQAVKDLILGMETEGDKKNIDKDIENKGKMAIQAKERRSGQEISHGNKNIFNGWIAKKNTHLSRLNHEKYEIFLIEVTHE